MLSCKHHSPPKKGKSDPQRRLRVSRAATAHPPTPNSGEVRLLPLHRVGRRGVSGFIGMMQPKVSARPRGGGHSELLGWPEQKGNCHPVGLEGRASNQRIPVQPYKLMELDLLSPDVPGTPHCLTPSNLPLEQQCLSCPHPVTVFKQDRLV